MPRKPPLTPALAPEYEGEGEAALTPRAAWAAVAAVLEMLRRIQTDPDLAFELIGTKAYRLLLEAEAALTGEDLRSGGLETVARRRMEDRQPPDHRRRAAR